MARGKKRRSSKRKFTIPIALVAGLMPGVSRSFTHFQAGGFRGLSTEVSRIYLGYDPPSGTWNTNLMWFGFFPLVLGLVVHKAAGVLGINRALSRAGIPVIRV